ncbi:U3 small nucleolar RNA-associated protein 6 homolog [Aplysia californica]|uniref:U3 small nucleolar RNA-associated protein 6 homolog n=1 Tax=Aplysia californica TaxID=6500 RepID=A0ABM1VV75_APLCA|nr:U3 small nucleolar RNA-associated protein 6 homolog [Aplysia californica]
MAEYVHQTLEEMIPELEEMTRLGLFTAKETKIILKNRESFEYRLRQLTKTKASFLNYVEYEKKLLELLKIRRKKVASDSRKRELEKSIADRIHQLYRLVTVRFQEDVSLWLQHIDFSKALNEKAYVTRLYEKVLKIHSHNEDVWVQSARWESSTDGNGNHELAREILLKAHRVNPESQTIFLEMYHMELQLAKQIIKRKSVLGLPSNMEGPKEDNGAEEDKTAELKLAEIVYSKGLELFRGLADFHMKMLSITSKFKEARKLQAVIVADLQRLYPTNPYVWNGLALRHLNSLKKIGAEQRKVAVAQCLKVYDEAVEKVPTVSNDKEYGKKRK